MKFQCAFHQHHYSSKSHGPYHCRRRILTDCLLLFFILQNMAQLKALLFQYITMLLFFSSTILCTSIIHPFQYITMLLFFHTQGQSLLCAFPFQYITMLLFFIVFLLKADQFISISIHHHVTILHLGGAVLGGAKAHFNTSPCYYSSTVK